MIRSHRLALALALGVFTACAPTGSSTPPAGGSSAPGAQPARAAAPAEPDLASQAARLERERDANPNHVDTRVALGEVYYRIARDALDRDQDETRYLDYLALSVDEFVSASELDPSDQRPHFYLAVMDTYRGDIKQALRGFDNARRLQPSGIAYTNIAEIFIYMGAIDKAYSWNDMGVRRGAPASAVLFNEMLLAWREDDLRRAQSIFSRLRQHYPEAIETINVARLPKAPRHFEEFAAYCCGSPACGPYMKDPCGALELAVKEESLSEDATLRQLQIEIEKTRRLKKVYRQHKELDVEIEGAPATR